MRVLTKLAAGLMLVASLLASAAATAHGQGAGGSCTGAQRDAQLRTEQREVLAMLRPAPAVNLTTLRNEGDLSTLAALGYSFYPHQQVSTRGMGWPVFDPGSGGSAPGRPSLLLYAPTADKVTHPRDGFDFPYRLAGWAYISEYVRGVPPDILTCLGKGDWFVHERGIHTFHDGGFQPMRPPDDEPRGTAPGDDVPCTTDPLSEAFCTDRQPGDFGHPRSWDTHIWLDGDKVPTVSMTNPGRKIRGIDPQVGKAFFFPESSE